MKVLRKVQRLDSIRLDSTYFTDEGYFVDHPILTSVGIFEYMNPDGSIRRELRLPEHVFDPESLKTYKGKPIIITHDAGVVNKNNVDDEQIGTIMSAGYKDSEDVRAEIIIHDTDAMKTSGLKELSLGYNLDLIEEQGEWNGEQYDAIQTNIRINHLALVDSARAGEQARLNIDGSSEPTLKGGKAMRKKVTKKAVKATGRRTDSKKTRISSRKRNDGVDLTPEELEEAIAAYVVAKGQSTEETDEKETAFDAEEALTQVQENKDRRDSEGEPDDLEGALEVILQQDEDIDSLLNVIEQLQAEADVTAATDSDEENEDDDENSDEEENADDDEENVDEEEEENGDSSDDETSSINADSADRMIRQRLAICRVGDKLNMDGLESKSIMDAKKAIIKKVLPQMRMDGKGKAYINAAYDMAVEQASRRKDVNYQKAQMMGGNGAQRADSGKNVGSAAKARQQMIERREGGR